MSIITHPAAIRAVQIRAQMSALSLEEKGMRRRGRSVAAMLKEHYGLKRTATYAQVREKLQADLEEADDEFFTDHEEGTEQ